MKLLIVSNLYPRPDQPGRGLYNAQLFESMSAMVKRDEGTCSTVCLVPEWQVSKWRRIRGWSNDSTQFLPVPYVPLIGRSINATLYRVGMGPLVPMIRKADVIYTSWLYPDGVAVAGLARKENKPLWLMALGSDTLHLNVPARARQIVAACGIAKGIVCVWKGLADRLIRAGVDGRKIHVEPNGVDSQRFQFRRKSQISNVPVVSEVLAKASGRPIALFAGNLVEVKGPDVFVDMAANVFGGTASTPSADGVEAVPPNKLNPLFVLVGDGLMRSRLQQLVSNARRTHDILFLGNQPHDTVAYLMNAADCLCLTSRSEGMPNVVIEALASGLPVVATDVGAVSEMLTGEPGTWIVPVGDPDAVGAALKQAIGSPVDRPAMADRAAKRYSWERQAGSILGKIQEGL